MNDAQIIIALTLAIIAGSLFAFLTMIDDTIFDDDPLVRLVRWVVRH